MEKSQKKLICIVGATASGKTGLGVEIAKKLNGEIVSADSRQVFRGLDIGTGKDLDDYKGVPYHLIDICDPACEFTMFDWLDRAKIVLRDIWLRGKTPIVVGGTGLYVQALIEGFETKPTGYRIQDTNNVQISKYTRGELEKKTKEELQEILIDLDEEAFLTIDLNNPYRMVRAIEKAQSGERLIKTKPNFDFLLIGKEVEREELYSRIDKRVLEWFEQGFYEEVEGLLASGVDLEWLNRIGLEYRILAQFITQNSKPKSQKSHSRLAESVPRTSEEAKWEESCCIVSDKMEDSSLDVQNDIKFEEMQQRMQFAIHQYARRQLIWWRRFDVRWVGGREQAERIADKFLFDKEKTNE